MQSMLHTLSDRSSPGRRWLALGIVCLAQLMIVLDTTIVNVALPSIQRDLGFSQQDLTWVVNAFLITFGSLLLLAGRLGDLLGRRRTFLSGVVLFTLASALCGLAEDGTLLIAARFLQGVGAAAQASVILAIIVTEFPEPADRARAMSAYVFVSVAGGSLGLLAGGLLTELLSWHWIFFVNLPIGAATIGLGRLFVPADPGTGGLRGIDWLGSALVTVALMILVYAIVEVPTHGWGSPVVLGGAGIGLGMLAAFIAWEARIDNPILPLHILRLPGLASASIVRGFLVTGMYSTFFLGTIWLERVRHEDALQTGIAFLPWTITVAVLSLGVTARLVARLGPMRVLTLGLLAVAGGLAGLQSTTPTTAFFPDVFGAYLLIGMGIGSAFLPLLSIAMAGVPAAQAGLASGLTNVSQQVAGALGLAVLSTVATDRTRSLLRHEGVGRALTGGDHLAYLVATGCVLLGLGFAFMLLRPRTAALAALAAASPATGLDQELPLTARLPELEAQERDKAETAVLASQPA
jgi:EmrB/QacA subfamily drug resistance transporter